MRSALACAWCRKAKVKCQHNGRPPCRGCTQRPGRECNLTYPSVQIRQRQNNARSRSRHPRTQSIASGAAAAAAAGEPLPRAHSPRPRSITPPVPDPAGRPYSHNDMPSLDPDLVNAACHSFVQHFPEFGFIHLPTFLPGLHGGLVSKLKSSAIVILSSRNKDVSLDAQVVEQCAAFTRHGIMIEALEGPNVDTVQVLVMLSLYEWGNSRGFQSWMYLGMAIQMGEMLISNMGLGNDERTFLDQETVYRTMWACFVLNCILSGGKGRKDRFCFEMVPFPLPASDDDFTFQTCPKDRTFLSRFAYRATHAPMGEADRGKYGPQHYLDLTIKGIDIWSAVTSWANGGGRRGEPDNEAGLPWNKHSIWNKALSALEDWKETWAPNLVYTRLNSNMRAFVLRQHGPAFAMINLLYHVTVIFLHREYIPFLPHRVDKPMGPIDPPLLPNLHPPGWWETSAESMFDSAVSIVHIIQDLEENGVHLRTPLVGFWVYTATLTLQYGCAWPHMTRDPNQLPRQFDWAVSWLREHSKLWDIFKGWVKTVDNLQFLYETIKRDTSRYLAVGRDNFVELEDNIQRLAEIDPASPFASKETAQILVALSQSSTEPPIRRAAALPEGQAAHADPGYPDDEDPGRWPTSAVNMDDIMRAWFADQMQLPHFSDNQFTMN